MRERDRRSARRRPVEQRGVQPPGVPAAERSPRPSCLPDSGTVFSKSGYWDDRNHNITPEGHFVTDSVVMADGEVISIMTKEGQARAAQKAAALSGNPRVPAVSSEPSIGGNSDQSIADAEAGYKAGNVAKNRKTKSK